MTESFTATAPGSLAQSVTERRRVLVTGVSGTIGGLSVIALRIGAFQPIEAARQQGSIAMLDAFVSHTISTIHLEENS